MKRGYCKHCKKIQTYVQNQYGDKHLLCSKCGKYNTQPSRE